MTDYIVTRADESELEHHGVKGQKWGVKRYLKEAGYNTVSMYKHPVISAKANYKNQLKHPLSYSVGGKAYLKAANSEIRSKVAAKEAKKAAKLATGKKTSEVKSNASKRKSTKSSTGKKIPKAKSNASKKLSNAELREKLNRLTLENQLRQQESIANPAKQSFLKKAAAQVGNELLRNVAHEASQQIFKQVTTKVGPQLMSTVSQKASQQIMKQVLKNAGLQR